MAVIKYVLLNAVEERLVDEWRDYPFCGSFEIDLQDDGTRLELMASIDAHRRIDE